MNGDWLNGAGIAGSQPLMLGAGGLTVGSGTPATIPLALVLSAAQSWTVDGYLNVGDVKGAGVPLSIDLAAGSPLTVDSGAGVEVGSVAVSGAGTLTLNGGSLNGVDGGPVSLSGGVELQAPVDSSIGPLTLSGSTLALTSTGPERADAVPIIDVNGGLTLDAASTVVADLGWVGIPEGPGHTGYFRAGGQIDATGTVNLAGATLTLPAHPAGPGGSQCPDVGTGQVYTLIQTSGELLGKFAGIPDGTVVPLAPATCSSDPPTVQINYTAHAVTATVVNGDPSPTFVDLNVSPAGPVVNEPVTVTSTVSTLYGAPAGTVTVSYADGGTLPGCQSVPVEPTGSTYTATCQTSFAAAGSAWLQAVFDPSDHAAWPGETSTFFPLGVTVRRANSTAAIRASSHRLAPGVRVRYTVTIRPGTPGATKPSGTVTFLHGGKPIKSCARRRLIAGRTASAASCTISFAAVGSRSITARYGGNANFKGSRARPVTTVVTRHPESATALQTQLIRAIRTARFAWLWSRPSVSLAFHAAVTGQLVIRWYLAASGTHASKGTRRPLGRLIATTHTSVKAGASATIRLLLSRSAARALRHLRRAQLTADATFTATHAQPVTSSRSFTISR